MRARRAAAVTTTLDEAGTMVSHAVHATSSEPSYEVLKLGLSMTEATSAAGRGRGGERRNESRGWCRDDDAGTGKMMTTRRRAGGRRAWKNFGRA